MNELFLVELHDWEHYELLFIGSSRTSAYEFYYRSEFKTFIEDSDLYNDKIVRAKMDKHSSKVITIRAATLDTDLR